MHELRTKVLQTTKLDKNIEQNQKNDDVILNPFLDLFDWHYPTKAVSAFHSVAAPSRHRTSSHLLSDATCSGEDRKTKNTQSPDSILPFTKASQSYKRTERGISTTTMKNRGIYRYCMIWELFKHEEWSNKSKKIRSIGPRISVSVQKEFY